MRRLLLKYLGKSVGLSQVSNYPRTSQTSPPANCHPTIFFQVATCLLDPSSPLFQSTLNSGKPEPFRFWSLSVLAALRNPLLRHGHCLPLFHCLLRQVSLSSRQGPPHDRFPALLRRPRSFQGRATPPLPGRARWLVAFHCSAPCPLPGAQPHGSPTQPFTVQLAGCFHAASNVPASLGPCECPSRPPTRSRGAFRHPAGCLSVCFTPYGQRQVLHPHQLTLYRPSANTCQRNDCYTPAEAQLVGASPGTPKSCSSIPGQGTLLGAL